MRMGEVRRLGVVIWSDPDARTGVVWADDSGRLAYVTEDVFDRVEGRNGQWASATAVFPAVGDLVSFVEEFCADIRYARSVRILGFSGSTELRDVLIADGSGPLGD